MKYRPEFLEAIRKTIKAEIDLMERQSVDCEDYVYSELMQAEVHLIRAIVALKGEDEND
jgi:hypothetical protein